MLHVLLCLLCATNFRNLRALQRFWLRLFARHGDFPKLKLPGRRDLPDPRASVASVYSRFVFDPVSLSVAVALW